MTTGFTAGHGELGPDIPQWRRRALDWALWVGLGLGSVPLLVAFVVRPYTLPLGLRLFGLGLFLLVTALAVARRVAYTVRTWGFLLALLAMASVALAARGLEGSGRYFLVVLPLLATVLLGPRSGYAAAGMSLALFALMAFLYLSGFVAPMDLLKDQSLTPQLWILQGAMLVLVTGPILVLINRFVGLLQDALASERDAATRVAESNRERRYLERVVLQTGERQRRAVGHQLHDGPCQQITAALLRCKVAENSLLARGAREEAAHLEAITDLLDASVGEIHDLAQGLSPAEVSPSALAAALAGLAQHVRASAKIECDVLHDELVHSNDPAVTDQLFRIAQEAVSNALRHAKPSRILIELTRSDQTIWLRIQDDGTGIPPERREAGMGLRIMRYRAELLGGSLSVEPAAGGGTVVACALPLAGGQASQAVGR